MLTTTIKASLTNQTVPDIELSIDRKQLAFLVMVVDKAGAVPPEFSQFAQDLFTVGDVVSGKRKPLICDTR